MKAKLTFKSFKQEDVVIIVQLIGEQTLETIKAWWDVERVFNDTTRTRLHVELIDE